MDIIQFEPEVIEILEPEIIQGEYEINITLDTYFTEPNIEEFESNIYELESPSTTIAPTPLSTSSWRNIITTGLPPALLSIEDITEEEGEELEYPPFIASYLLIVQSLPFEIFWIDPWCFTPLTYLGQGIPCLHTPFGFTPRKIMSETPLVSLTSYF